MGTGDEGFFKEKELEAFEKKVVEVETWRDEKLAAQDEHPLSEMPKLTVSMIGQKIGDLDSEVKFLVQKPRWSRPSGSVPNDLRRLRRRRPKKQRKKPQKRKRKRRRKQRPMVLLRGQEKTKRP